MTVEQVRVDVSRFIKEMALDEGTAAPMESEKISPKDRLASLKALLATPKP